MPKCPIRFLFSIFFDKFFISSKNDISAFFSKIHIASIFSKHASF